MATIDGLLAAALAQAAQSAESFEVTPSLGGPSVVGPDLRLGDLVRVDARGVASDSIVVGITVKQTPLHGFSQTLEVGAVVPDGISSLFGSIEDLARRLAVNERR